VVARDYAEDLDHYAMVAAASIFAESRCPGFRVNAGRLTTLRMDSAISSTEEPLIEAKLRKWSSEVRQAYTRNGDENWCSEIYGLLGPNGTMAKSVLSR
jgi:hypothetical protein